MRHISVFFDIVLSVHLLPLSPFPHFPHSTTTHTMLRASLALPRHGVRAATFTRLAPFSTSATKFRQQHLSPVLNFSDEVKDALKNNKPIVALESTIISHGMPYPQNYETAIQVENIVRENGATPATIAILDGQIQIGLTNSQIQSLAELGRESVKASRRDLAVVMSKVSVFVVFFFFCRISAIFTKDVRGLGLTDSLETNRCYHCLGHYVACAPRWHFCVCHRRHRRSPSRLRREYEYAFLSLDSCHCVEFRRKKKKKKTNDLCHFCNHCSP